MSVLRKKVVHHSVPPVEVVSQALPCGIQVVIAAYNACSWLASTLASIEHAMGGQRWALVIGDDHSTDNTLAIAQAHQTSAAVKIVAPFGQKTPNVSHAKNLSLAMGEQLRKEFPVILMMDADDTMHRARVTELIPPLLRREAAQVTVGSHVFVSEDANAKSCVYSGRDMVESRQYLFGPWATAFKANMIPSTGVLFLDRIPAHEDALLWCRWHNSGVKMLGLDTPPVCTHYYRTGSVSANANLEVRNAAWNFFVNERAALTQGRVPSSFCTLATKEVLPELLLMLYSLRLYHALPVQVVCDDEVAAATEGKFENLHIHADLNGYKDRPLPADVVASYHNQHAVRMKMQALRRGFESGFSTLLVDSDIIFTGPVTGRWKTDLAMTTHHYGVGARENQTREERFGKWNTGFMFCQNPSFPDWWERAAFERSAFTDQQCMNDVEQDFFVEEMGCKYNFGFWRLERLKDRTPPPQQIAHEFGLNVTADGIFLGWEPLQSLHVHLWHNQPMFRRMQQLARWLLKTSPRHSLISRMIERFDAGDYSM